MVHRGTDIHRLLTRSLKDWKECNFDEFVAEFEWCARLLPQTRCKDKKDHCVKVFIRLIFQGQVHSACSSIYY